MIVGPISRPSRQVRVWVGELPERIEGKVLTATKACAEDANAPKDAIIAVEMKIDISPSYMYGLLGGIFHKEASGNFRTLIRVTKNKGREFVDSLAQYSSDRVIWALPQEYSDAVLQTIMRHKLAPCGTLEINCAACSEVGSNQVIFACLTQVLIAAVLENSLPEQIATIALESNTANARTVLGLQ